MYYIYMLRCRDGSFYTGIAADIEKRLRQHASGGAACAKYTRAHPPEALAALWQAEDHAAAARLEALMAACDLPRDIAAATEMEQRYRAAMADLDPLDRLILTDSCINGRAQWKIGQSVGYSVEAVQKRLRKIVSRMAEMMPAAMVMATVEEPTEMRTRAATMKATSTSGRLAFATALPMTSPRPVFCSI